MSMLSSARREGVELCASLTSAYLKLWKKGGVDYSTHLPATLKNCPRLVQRSVQLEVAMQVQGLVPLFHAMPCGARVITAFERAKQGIKRPFYTPLRPAHTLVSLREAKKNVPACKETNAKPHLLSCSYAFASGIAPLESAASWLSTNHGGNEMNFSLLNGFTDLLASVRSPHGEVISYFRERGWNLIARYGRLQVGRLYVLGLTPKQMIAGAYDSLAFNVPTQKAVLSVARYPERHLSSLRQHGYHMATLIASKEMLGVRQAPFIVEANNQAQVHRFCKASFGLNMYEGVAGCSFQPQFHGDTLYKQMGLEKSVSFEKEQEQTRNKLDAETEKLAKAFGAFVKKGVAPTFEKTLFEVGASDFPSLLP